MAGALTIVPTQPHSGFNLSPKFANFRFGAFAITCVQGTLPPVGIGVGWVRDIIDFVIESNRARAVDRRCAAIAAFKTIIESTADATA